MSISEFVRVTFSDISGVCVLTVSVVPELRLDTSVVVTYGHQQVANLVLVKHVIVASILETTQYHQNII